MSKGQIPNIFIKEIDLFDASNEEMSIKVTTVIGDSKDSNSWSTPETSQHMRVLMVVSSNVGLNDGITQGQIQFDKDFLTSNYGEDETVKIISRPAKSLNQIDSEDNVRFIDSYGVKFNNQEQQIKVFCSVYFEMSEILQAANLDFSGAVRRYGNIASDSVIDLGSVVSTATVFVLPTGEQYSGPVHLHPEKGYMVGPRHIEEEHNLLTTLDIINFKIKDFRKKQFDSPKAIGEKQVSSFSDLKYSINNEGNVTGIFSINFKNLVLYNTKYGYFLRTLSQQAISENINNIKIKNLQITRKRMDVDETAIIVKSFSTQPGSQINPVQEDFGLISEINTGQNDIRMFQFTDKTVDKTSLGRYQYRLNLTFKDPTVDFVLNIIDDLRVSEKEISDYYTMVERSKNYDFDLNRTKSRLYESQFNDFNISDPDNPSWSTANEVYVRASSYLYELTNKNKRDLTNSISTKVDPRNATLFSLRGFSEDLSKLTRDFESSFDLSNNNTQADSVKTFVNTPNSRNVIFLDYLFKEAVVLKNYSMSYNYMNMSTSEGAAILQSEQFENRANNEFNKFFNSSPSDKDTELVPRDYETLLDLQENLYSFLSPNLMVFGKDLSTNLKDISTIKLEEINKIFNPSFDTNVFNVGRPKPEDLKNVTEEMSKPNSEIKKEKSNAS
jgi:hypothetical protein